MVTDNHNWVTVRHTRPAASRNTVPSYKLARRHFFLRLNYLVLFFVITYGKNDFLDFMQQQQWSWLSKLENEVTPTDVSSLNLEIFFTSFAAFPVKYLSVMLKQT